MKVQIPNLNQRQRLLADLIWACTTREQALTLIKSLQGRDHQDARSIMQLMIMEVQEDLLDDYKAEFNEVWYRIRNPS